MRKMLILLALTVLAASTSGCCRSRVCRNLLRRGSPCGGTTLAAPAMLGGAIPLGNPVSLPAAPQVVQPQFVQPQIVQPQIIAQPNCNCQQAAPICCEPCPTQCVPCDPCVTGGTGYIGADCGCETTAPGEYFGGYLEGSSPPPVMGGAVVPQGSGTFPQPTN
ncbi:MAG: hypothetical protein AAGD11_07820 [Planctomycetota bacterium]